MKRGIYFLTALLFVFFLNNAFAQIPRVISYQGMLLGSNEQPVPEGQYKLTFKIYNEANNLLWTEVHNQVFIGGGMFTVFLGSLTPLSIPFDKPYLLGIQVGSDPELVPRMPITSSAYAIRAEDADKLMGIFASPTPQPNKLLPLDASGKFPASVISGGGAGEFIKKNVPDTSIGTSTNPLMLISNLGDGDGINGRSVNGVGIRGRSENNDGIVSWTGASDKSGVFGWSANGKGVTGRSDKNDGVLGGSTDGKGVTGRSDKNDGVVGFTGGASDKNGVYGHTTTGNGVKGFSDYNSGVFGVSNNDCAGGVRGLSTHAGGFGAVGVGNNLITTYMIAAGAGVGGYGAMYGVEGRAANNSGDRAGGIFVATGGPTAFVGAVWGGTQYKIIGGGNVSTVMATREGKKVLFAPECPEPYFEDFGQGRLLNGNAHIKLDPLFLDCIKTDAEHPMKVFIQLNDDCNGVYVKVGTTGFDVYELQNGKSDAAFTYRVIGNRGDTDYLRLPPAATEVSSSVVK